MATEPTRPVISQGPSSYCGNFEPLLKVCQNKFIFLDRIIDQHICKLQKRMNIEICVLLWRSFCLQQVFAQFWTLTFFHFELENSSNSTNLLTKTSL